MMQSDSLEELVKICAVSEDSTVRTRLTNEISEALYEGAEGLIVLTPLFEGAVEANWISLSLILEEHSHRAQEVVDWLEQLIGSRDVSVRFRALLCVMELEAEEHPAIVARMLETLSDQEFVAGRVAVVQYLAHVAVKSLRAAVERMTGDLRTLLTDFIENAPFDGPVGDDESDETLIQIAWAARQHRDLAVGRLGGVSRRPRSATQLAAETLLRQVSDD